MLRAARSRRTELQRGTRQIRDSVAEKIKERWRVKKMHGQMSSNLDEKLAVNEQSYRWLKFRDIQWESESAVVAPQDQAVIINRFINKVLKEELTVNTGYVNSVKKLLTT
jgi:IS30 family transposase